jgi:hypothetical protein
MTERNTTLLYGAIRRAMRMKNGTLTMSTHFKRNTLALDNKGSGCIIAQSIRCYQAIQGNNRRFPLYADLRELFSVWFPFDQIFLSFHRCSERFTLFASFGK